MTVVVNDVVPQFFVTSCNDIATTIFSQFVNDVLILREAILYNCVFFR